MTNDTISILAVEDESINQMVFKMFFKTLGLKAHVVDTGAQALLEIQNQHHDYHLVFMDLGLPDISGIDVTVQIRQFEQQNQLDPLYICALTATNDEKLKQQALKVGMNEFMTKPITLEAIKQTLEVFNISLA
ncbi:MAG: response regulator [Gammaproteobacteria bacterium]